MRNPQFPTIVSVRVSRVTNPLRCSQYPRPFHFDRWRDRGLHLYRVFSFFKALLENAVLATSNNDTLPEVSEARALLLSSR